MTTWISYVYLVLNKATKERTVVGLVMGNDHASVLRFSKSKIRKTCDIHPALTSAEAFDLARMYDGYDEWPSNNLEMFHKSLSRDRVSYFATSLEGTLSFSPPEDIAVPFTKSMYAKLFAKYVTLGSSGPHVKSEISISDSVHKKFTSNPIIAERASIDVTLSPENSPNTGIIFPIKVDLLTENSRYLSANAINLNAGNYHLNATALSLEKVLSVLTIVSEANGKEKYPESVLIHNNPKTEIANSNYRLLKSLSPFELCVVDEIDALGERLEKEGFAKPEFLG